MYDKIAFRMGRPSEQYDISGAPQFPAAKSEYVVHLDLIQLNPAHGITCLGTIVAKFST
jgi:hypothetical protein